MISSRLSQWKASARRRLRAPLDRYADRLLRRINQSRAVYCGDHVVLTTIRNGRRIYLDIRDASVAAAIALGRDYEGHVAATLRAVAQPGDTFFDVGANVGYHSLLLADLLADGTRSMHVFEPNPHVFACLRRTIHTNSLWADVVPNELALSDRTGTAELAVYQDQTASATLQSGAELAAAAHPWATLSDLEATHTVRTTTVDDYCTERGINRIGLMKIDAEGHEEAVFAGMADVLDRSPDLRVVLEFTFGSYPDPEAFWDRLSQSFPYRFHIGPRGELHRVESLGDLRALTSDELADVLLTRQPLAVENPW